MSMTRTAFFTTLLTTGLLASAAAAQNKPAVLLRTATSLAYEAPNGAAAVAKNTGAGVMDAKPTFRKVVNPDGSFKVRIGTIFTISSPTANNDGSHMQGSIFFSDLTADKGLVHLGRVDMPILNGERAFMRPLLGLGQQLNFALAVFATEDNGANNNPQTSAFVTTTLEQPGMPAGAMVPIVNSTRGGDRLTKPTNLVSLTDQANNDQTFGPHSICPLGLEGAGEAFLVGMQRNNANAMVMKILVEAAPGGAKVTVPYFKQLVQDAKHCRPQVTCPLPGSYEAYMTTVEGNNQPADAIALVKFDARTGNVIQSKNIVESDPNGTNTGTKMHAVQNSGLIHLGGGLGAMGFQKSANAKNNNNNPDGHSGGVNLSSLVTVRLADLQVLEAVDNVAPYQRHAFSFPMIFGAGMGKPAIGVMGGSSTGIGKGKLQIVEVDAVGKPSVNPNLRLEVSLFSDVANLPARGKRNPNNQGAGFLNGIGGIENPGYGKPNGFIPEARTFFLTTLPGFAKDPGQFPGTNRESLWISLVPATWDEKIDAVPGPVTADVKPGPSPSAAASGAAAAPGTPPAANLQGIAGADLGATNDGCSCRTTAAKAADGRAGLVGLLFAVATVARRLRRRETQSS